MKKSTKHQQAQVHYICQWCEVEFTSNILDADACEKFIRCGLPAAINREKQALCTLHEWHWKSERSIYIVAWSYHGEDVDESGVNPTYFIDYNEAKLAVDEGWAEYHKDYLDEYAKNNDLKETISNTSSYHHEARSIYGVMQTEMWIEELKPQEGMLKLIKP